MKMRKAYFFACHEDIQPNRSEAGLVSQAFTQTNQAWPINPLHREESI
jgi:hypothetical protein